MREYLLYIKESNTEAKSMITPCFALDNMFWGQHHGVKLHVLGKSASLSLIVSLRSLVNEILTDQISESYSNRNPLSAPFHRTTTFVSAESYRLLAESVLITIRSRIQKYMQELQYHAPFTFFPLESTSSENHNQAPEPISLIETERRARELSRQLVGRALLLEEIEVISKLSREMIVWIVHLLVLVEQIEWQPGITIQVRKGWIKNQLLFTCLRCGARDVEIKMSSGCLRCGQACWYCSRCLQMGRSTCCTPYICMPLESALASSITAFSKRSHIYLEASCNATELMKTPLEAVQPSTTARVSYLQWEGTFSPLQADAAKRAVDFVRGSVTSEFLIWAVCGAGKTELVFLVIDEVLSKGGRVLLATPRKDVVLELTPRLRKVFPGIIFRSVHGSSEEKWEEGQLIISTTHQVIRMYRAFELVILDEVDAFPYHNNPMLYRAVDRARAVDGKLLYLTATPPDYLRKRLVSSTYKQFSYHSATHTLIPTRFHGHPIPVPVYLSIPKWDQKIEKHLPIIPLIESIKDSLDSQHQVFVFVPRIADVMKVLTYLKKFLPSYEFEIEGVYSSDDAREQKVLLFRQKQLRLLVTTTILERGVTIPKSDVFILGADSEIFDEASLVQIAGRVGRSADSPNGKVVFGVTARSKQTQLAIKQITEMNKLGQGLRKKEREYAGT